MLQPIKRTFWEKQAKQTGWIRLHAAVGTMAN